MNKNTLEIINRLGLTYYDEMGYELTDKAQYHHIVKLEDYGLTTIDNGACLSPEAHQYLHLIEYKDKSIYDAINGILKIIALRGEITERDYILIDALLRDFEIKFKNSINAKGKSLIRTKYLKRKTTK